jgi:hypothetical protein
MAVIMKLEEMSPLSDEQIFVKNQLYQSVVKAMSHSAVLQTWAVTNSVLERRRVFIDQCPSSKVPSSAREWLVCQPFLSNPNSPLFGDVQAEQ